MNYKEEIKKLLDSDKMIIGASGTLKALRNGSLAKVYISTNPKKELVEDIKHFAQLSNVEIVEVGIPNDELGVVCKKPFAISVIGVRS